MILAIGIVYFIFDYSEKNKNNIVNSVNEVEESKKIVIRQNSINFINTLELELALEIASGNTTNLNCIYKNNIDNYRGEKPINLSLDIKMGKVTNGVLEYEKYLVKIIDGKISEITRK